MSDVQIRLTAVAAPCQHLQPAATLGTCRDSSIATDIPTYIIAAQSHIFKMPLLSFFPHATMAETSENGPVFFWHAEGDNGYCGQWYYAPWEHDGVKYETAEMWMMVQKALLFKDEVQTFYYPLMPP